MTTLYFADLDILLKLAACDLLSELREHWQIPPNQCFVRQSFLHKLEKSLTRQNTYTAETLLRTKEFLLAHTTPITFTDKAEEAVLQQVGIDDGERTLVIATKEPADRDQPFFLATGDKRAISALALLPSSDSVCKGIADRLQGRIICLESMMLTFIDILGFEVVKTKVLASRHNDKYASDGALKAAFGSHEKAEEPNVRATLQSYIAALPASFLVPYSL